MMGEWISVKKNLPPNDETVIAHLKIQEFGISIGVTTLACYSDKQWYDVINNAIINNEHVTHWILFPKAPEGEAEE